MLLAFDYSLAMARQIIAIDQNTFGDIPYTPEELVARMKSTNNYFIYIYYIQDQPIGYISLMLVQNLHYKAFWIDLLAVDPQFQGKKYAQEMIETAKKIIAEDFQDIDFISALVRCDNLSSLGALHAQNFSTDTPSDFKLLFCSDKEDL